MKKAAFITIGIVAVFLVTLFLIFMSITGRETKGVTGSVAPDGTVFKGPTEPPPGALRNDSPRLRPEPESGDGDTLPTLE